ncbi:MAG: type II secretion system protein GspM [Wenzhouxiangella sp.]
MKNWWQQLEPRQQGVILTAGVILLALLVYLQAFEPMAEARQAERERVAQQQALVAWLEAVEPTVARARTQQRPVADLDGRSLLGITDQTARAAGLAGSLTRIEPAGERQVRVWLDGADFVATMTWLQDFSRDYAVEISQLNMDRAQRPGQVNVRLTLER